MLDLALRGGLIQNRMRWDRHDPSSLRSVRDQQHKYIQRFNLGTGCRAQAADLVLYFCQGLEACTTTFLGWGTFDFHVGPFRFDCLTSSG